MCVRRVHTFDKWNNGTCSHIPYPSATKSRPRLFYVGPVTQKHVSSNRNLPIIRLLLLNNYTRWIVTVYYVCANINHTISVNWRCLNRMFSSSSPSIVVSSNRPSIYLDSLKQLLVFTSYQPHSHSLRFYPLSKKV